MTNNTATSPLAKQLEELISSGLVKPAMMPSAHDFPTARVVVPVYDSTGVGSLPVWQGDRSGRLAPNS